MRCRCGGIGLLEVRLTINFTECARSAQCIGYKHHYQECVERVTAQHEDESYKGPKEDCVEECKQKSASAHHEPC